ncbi:MAG: TraR/DksA family transcriptional regulator [Acidiferrobacterales bacterium]
MSKESESIDLVFYQKCLLARKRAILLEEEVGISGAAIVTLDQSSVGRVSRVNALQEQAMSLAAQERRAAELARIATALLRVDEGEYGYCLNCGELISLERLEIDLSAEHCVVCASRLEKQ